MNKVYVAIVLKSFYASCECVELGLDPLNTNLVVADQSRTEKTICLAVSPSLKSYGISGRARLFEVVQRVKEVNEERQKKAPRRQLTDKSCIYSELVQNPSLAVDYVVATPQMAHYKKISAQIYGIYLKYVAPEDIHVYSIDEVFIDITGYLKTYNMNAREMAKMIISDVLKTTGVTATAGIGTNLYIAKIAMDVMAKRIPEDKDGVRIAELDEITYRKEMWNHRPLSDFWRIGRGYTKKLEENGLYTMGDIARYSLSSYGENKLYKLFGVNAELLIDHAWGWEPCTIRDIKSYKPSDRSICSGQVLHCPYNSDKTKLVVREMIELMSLELIEKRMVTDQIVLTVGYDVENLKNPGISKNYKGEITTDNYGRKIPKHAHGTANIGKYTSSAMLMMESAMELFERIINRDLLVRRINISVNHVIYEKDVVEKHVYEQFDLFTDYEKEEKEKKLMEQELFKERKIQEATIELRKKYGKNVVLKGCNLKEGATAIERGKQIGGHKA